MQKPYKGSVYTLLVECARNMEVDILRDLKLGRNVTIEWKRNKDGNPITFSGTLQPIYFWNIRDAHNNIR